MNIYRDDFDKNSCNQYKVPDLTPISRVLNINYSRGPRIKPWGTERVNVLKVELVEPMEQSDAGPRTKRPEMGAAC